MSEKKDGGPAFPVIESFGTESVCTHPGMELRDWFAGQALAGMMARPNLCGEDVHDCYRIADAMLAAREAKDDQG
ncbi:MAG: hypothetical protein FWE09_00250 [Treponema sp.]|nr:hypothetical protein [Treponema sp.]